MKRWMIYGANGYTGRLVARLSKQRGLEPVLAGRRRDAVEALARELSMESRVFDLADAGDVARALDGVTAVLHCAGPFSATSTPMLQGCLRAGAHYLDITGEIDVFESIHARGAELRGAGIVAMPGVGFDVVPSDCLAAMLKRELPTATHLKLALLWLPAKLSPGTTKTMFEGIPHGGRIRRDGRIVAVPPAWKVEHIAFTADIASSAVTIPWGDVSTAYYSTGIPNIEVFAGVPAKQIAKMKVSRPIRWLMGLAPVQAFAKAQIARRVKGPSEQERARGEAYLYGEVRDGAGKSAVLRLRTPEGYTLTADAAIAATLRVVQDGLVPGAYTPSMAFGPDFVLSLEGTRLIRPG
jgi:short subunit dehydrogenase-like uncharacterized protein